jgi:hypothetical protein
MFRTIPFTAMNKLVKVTLLIIAIVVTWYLHKTMKREVAGLKLVSAACLLWAAVTIGGRLTAYLGSLCL